MATTGVETGGYTLQFYLTKLHCVYLSACSVGMATSEWRRRLAWVVLSRVPGCLFSLGAGEGCPALFVVVVPPSSVALLYRLWVVDVVICSCYPFIFHVLFPCPSVFWGLFYEGNLSSPLISLTKIYIFQVIVKRTSFDCEIMFTASYGQLVRRT